MSDNGFKETDSNNKIIMMKIQNEIKDIVITKYLSIIMIQEKEISMLKTQCEEIFQLSTKILKKTILDETSSLNPLNNINKNKNDGTSKKSTLNSSNDNLNNNSSKLITQLTNINIINNHNKNANINNVNSGNNNENKKLEKKINKDLSKSKLGKNLVIPLQRSESSSFLIEKNNNYSSNINQFSSQSESARKLSKKKILYSNRDNIKEKNNIKQNKILTKSFSKKNINKNIISNINTPLLTEPSENISRNSMNNFESLNIKKKIISNSSSSVFDNKHSKIIQKKIQNDKSLTNTSFISHVKNVNKGKEKLKVNMSKSILNNSNSKQNILSNVNNNYRKDKKLTIISEKDNENKNDKIDNFP